MRAPRVSPDAFRRLALLNVVLLVAIIVSGAIVRLSRSGLGCADWPNCNETKLIDVSSSHSAIEQINRLFSGLILVPVALALVAAYLRTPRRRDLVRLSWLALALLLGNAVLGGISVIVKLAWVSVMGHFLLAIALVGVALLVHRRARTEATATRPVVSPRVVFLARVVYVLTIAVLVLGTLVTAAGPHGGDDEATRLGWPLGDAARAHGVLVDVLVLLVIVLIVVLVREGAPPRVRNAATLAVCVMAAQGVLGYVQYFNRIPAVLVGFHVFGATMVFVAVQLLYFSLYEPVDAPSGPAEPAVTPVAVS